MDKARNHVKRVINSQGIAVTVIPEIPEHKTADFFIPEDACLIEVKSNEDLARELAEAADGEAHLREEVIRYNNSIDRVIDDAGVQLKETPGVDAKHRALWFVTDDQATRDIFRRTFLGDALIVDLDDIASGTNICHGFTHSSAFNNPHIAFVVLEYIRGNGHQITLLLNPIASIVGVSKLKIWQAMCSAGAGVVDSREDEKRGAAFLIESKAAIHVGDTQAALSYLRKKYHRPRLDVLEFNAVSVTMSTKTK